MVTIEYDELDHEYAVHFRYCPTSSAIGNYYFFLPHEVIAYDASDEFEEEIEIFDLTHLQEESA